ncbi:YbhB/YbcL family Raf kinase inhibitor-like protein [Desulfovibrio psychrotolerans]|uniref:Phosphatidylethanolamine-binding protein n=1 Tax=Desulfovibrio psychrotolerans TaxID=415242 RepID=A0A7J0BXJ7_9BACT|nr:YbhB/YbcL family Raf kinase inhibitor-like protein [Desulfovibrio psychrotolerans]GFM37891.1 hypothetical protein DSM19430T_25750 [Desulfovibrio psychrotolerans]
MRITSTAFAHGDTLPLRHAADGENLSPPLAWEDVPPQAKYLTLICDSALLTDRQTKQAEQAEQMTETDTQDHWLLYNLPATMTGLEEGVAREFDPFPGAGHGLNSCGNASYDGPKPTGKARMCQFTLHALDARVSIKPGATKGQVQRAMEGHILATARLMVRILPR